VDLIIRTAIAFAFILLVTRVIGRRELSGLEPFDLILLVVVGDLIQQGVTQNDESVTGMLIVVGTLTVLTVMVSYMGFRMPRVRRALEGIPIVLIEDGSIVTGNLNSERLSVSEIEAEARAQQITSLTDVKFAILETNGKISFIPFPGSG
jgi:uncharacterized membrane protein YcaP (DUF421 family)